MHETDYTKIRICQMCEIEGSEKSPLTSENKMHVQRGVIMELRHLPLISS